MSILDDFVKKALASKLTLESAIPESTSRKEEGEFKKSKPNYYLNSLKVLQNKRFKWNTTLRLYLSIWASLVVSCWLWKVGEILVNNTASYKLDNSVLITLISTTTVNVLGLVLIVMSDLFNGKSEVRDTRD